ncbi:hypothetical protein AO369_0445 [Moraxella catarrhalis]|nr:hypothetical protein AO369_0445 [Moraxella catarrhalis]
MRSKVFNAINVIMIICKFFGMINSNQILYTNFFTHRLSSKTP